MGVSYKNRSTGDVVTLPKASARLDRLDRWERIEAAPADPEYVEGHKILSAATGNEPDEAGPPPMVGPGSGRDEWAAYAESQGVEVSEDMSRKDIWAALEGDAA
jgi:hypothetical protein